MEEPSEDFFANWLQMDGIDRILGKHACTQGPFLGLTLVISPQVLLDVAWEVFVHIRTHFLLPVFMFKSPEVHLGLQCKIPSVLHILLFDHGRETHPTVFTNLPGLSKLLLGGSRQSID